MVIAKLAMIISARCLCHVEFPAWRAETSDGQLIGALSTFYIKQIQNIMKNQLCMNASKNYR